MLKNRVDLNFFFASDGNFVLKYEHPELSSSLLISCIFIEFSYWNILKYFINYSLLVIQLPAIYSTSSNKGQRITLAME